MAGRIGISVGQVQGFAPIPPDAPAGPLPAAVAQAVFGGAARTVALLDAARLKGLTDLAAATGLRRHCLFTGELAKAEDAVPWLMALGPGDKLSRYLFTDGPEGRPGPWHFWPLGAGVLIRTTLPDEALRTHLRRFLRATDEAGKAYFFRFWEPTSAAPYFANLADRPELIARWFRPREGGAIEAILAGDPATGLWRIAPEGLDDAPHEPRGSFVISASDMAALATARMNRDLDQLAGLLIRTYPETVGARPRADIVSLTRRTVSRMRDYGFVQRDYLFRLLAWEAHFGPNVESRDPEGRLRAICTSDRDEAEKFDAFAARAVALFESGGAEGAVSPS